MRKLDGVDLPEGAVPVHRHALGETPPNNVLPKDPVRRSAEWKDGGKEADPHASAVRGIDGDPARADLVPQPAELPQVAVPVETIGPVERALFEE